ncbi:MAG TPA: class I SAM-dependent methyltransferase [Segetibacter sp.]|jgi:ubiquinone/menaquinone biosynthesis C-methylase UbiE
MNNQEAYNIWAEQYDTSSNRTRDIEGVSLRSTLNNYKFSSVLEIGCGTGKNSEWLITQAQQVVAVDFSDEMLAKAKSKITALNIDFIKADITGDWVFTNEVFELITFSLVLEHIEDLNFVFKQVKQKITAGGYVYVGELHPFKQYSGSLARFDSQDERVKLKCFTHNISEFIDAATNQGLSLIHLNEWFDDDNKATIPRLLTLLFKAG